MKIKYYILLLAMAILVTVGCNNDDKPSLNPNKKIEFKTSIATETAITSIMKSPQLDQNGKGNFTNGDTFSLQISAQSGEVTVLRYTIEETDLYWKDININSEDKAVDFAACYPEQKLIDGKFSFNIETAPYKDLLWAHEKKVPVLTISPVNLTFKHVMHRLIINFTKESDINPELITTICTAKSMCEVDLIKGTLNDISSAKASLSEVGPQAVFQIIPQKTSDVFIEVKAEQLERKFNLTEAIKEYDNLESGMSLTVNITLKDGKILFEGNSIAGWEDQGSVEGEIIM